jgi:hypothetical protein
MNASDKPDTLNKHREKVYLLYNHCRSLFTGFHLPSHDHLHHLRVWNYTMDILHELSGQGRIFHENELLLLMLSVFFHDTGLTVTLEEDHGTESRRLCEDFLSRNPGLFPIDVSPALQAIELHDKKQSQLSLQREAGMDTLRILSVCDDTDAYGPTGIIRYAEIYLARNIPLDSLPEKVLENLAYRFKFLTAQDWIPEGFINKHTIRYGYTVQFYRELQNGSDSPEGINAGIIESYMEDVWNRKKTIMDFALSLKENNNNRMRIFGSCLLGELQNDIKNFGLPDTPL